MTTTDETCRRGHEPVKGKFVSQPKCRWCWKLIAEAQRIAHNQPRKETRPMQHELTLIRQDIDDLPPSTRLVVINEVIASIEGRDPETWSNVDRNELPALRDMRDHLKLNIDKARAQNAWLK
jgi:hypothetical protein